MDAMVRAAPPPGSANAGDLYVDLQSRTLWLGVDPAVDEAGFVLISDIESLEAGIAGSLVESKLYTDAQILTRAPSVHTHTANQIIDFNAAVAAAVALLPGASGWIKGMVAMWSGSLAEIGVGDLAGWALCDGGGTPPRPDLRDKFVVGAGHRAVGVGNPASSLTTTGGGTHIHTINGTALTDAQMPNHNHGGITGYVPHNHTHTVSGVTDAQGYHSHQVPMGRSGSGGTGADTDGAAPASFYLTTGMAGLHQHNWSGTSSGISQNHYHSIPAEGSGQAHTHTMLGGGGIHEHSVSSAQLRDTIPWYAMAFIVKL